MNIKQYRIFDLLVLSLIGFIFNFINITAIRAMKMPMFTFDFTIVIVLIAVFRWGWHGLLVSIIMTFTRLIMFETYSFGLYLVEISVCVSIALITLWFKFFSRKETQKNWLLLFLYVITAYLITFVTRCLIYWVLGQSVINFIASWPFNNLVSLIFVFALMVIAGKQKGILVDMQSYLQQNSSRGESHDE